ncbi:auxin efflux carrier component 5 isoform X1 [Gastrolobium bilobum]|uniref:auxin efflux carrier component 5 isoform X1 n=1 Tax=Gastrolobium bilobum TaxID=150636 RepID=UPI002AAF3F81|nr:auxin efflux carrier component 5 isoform X1 [Gastrolobium bilobum]XP_061357416.1 auxin efflux carrier component 5 isoform X1 [Gastrolobium bilobum]
MIGLEDVYKVVVAVVPLYFALVLGYGSVRWWNIFTREQCDAINKLVCYFTLPFFTFQFTAHIDPFKMNFMFIVADTISKFVIVAVLALWAKCSSKASSCWFITSFSLCTLTNALVVGVPMVKAMYGPLGVDLVVQASVVQAIIWLTLLLFVLEFRRAGIEGTTTLKSKAKTTNMTGELGGEGKDVEATTTTVALDVNEELVLEDTTVSSKPPFFKLMKLVWIKLIMNPNTYGCVIGVSWAFISNSRWNLEMPSMIEGSVLIMSKAGTGTAMFSMGIFMALQEKVISCGPSLTVFGLVLKFIAGPAAMAISAIVVGLRGDVLRVAIIQAAVPQSITSFIYAKEYGVHPEVLSTAVIFGMIVSLPVLIAYYAILEFVGL